ncbi:hypothetical protein PHMEG_00016716 [Phytophthora megakarya]|uniref:Uncharacterized protein n=1 Tax=Phytophthora megakarya TaxID=4795 RepID=A0A225VYK0_9STRA|nr:hypothetical protein PHMEG_00016716 [Phytophthora megakarya]
MAHGIRPKYTMYFQPGEYGTIRLPAFRKLMRPSTIWAGRGDRWVTQVLYAWKVPAAVKVVNISDRISLIYENTISAKAQARESQRLDDLQKMEPPAVQTPNYPWPTKMMIRLSPGCEEARVINLQIVPSEVYGEPVEEGERLSMRTPIVATTVPEVSKQSGVGDKTTDVPMGEGERTLDDQDSDDDEFFDSINVEDGFPEVSLEDIPEVEPEDDVFSDLPVSVIACTPIQQLDLEYERVMRISAEELDLDPESDEAVVTLDFKMKLEPLYFREKTVDHYGKRGISWYGALVHYFKYCEETLDFEVAAVDTNLYFDHLAMEDSKQEKKTVISLVEAVIMRLRRDLPNNKRITLFSDNASC